MKHNKKIISTVGLILIALTGYHLLWGRLFPFSPIIIGFEQEELNSGTVYYGKGIDISKYKTIDSLIDKVEKFHRLQFKKKVKIFVMDSNKEFVRRTGVNTRFVTLPLHGRIFVSNKARKEIQEGKIHEDVYLKHELSHSLLYQNMSLYRSQYYPGWLLEGIAVYSSNQMGVDGYFNKKETFNKIRDGYFLNPDDWSTTLLKPQSKNVKNFPLTNKYWFIYSEFGCLVEDLIQNYGKDKFFQYMTEALEEKDDKKLFLGIFGIEFNEYVDGFKNRIGYNSRLKSSSKTLNLK
jgi:hypothetical protein